MAGDTLLVQDGLHIVGEIDFGVERLPNGAGGEERNGTGIFKATWSFTGVLQICLPNNGEIFQKNWMNRELIAGGSFGMAGSMVVRDS